MNYPLIKTEHKESQQFDSNHFASSLTQDMSIYAEICHNNDAIFDNYFPMDYIDENVG